MSAPRWRPRPRATSRRAFDVFLRGVGGDRYREVLRARFGDDGLVEAERESAYFFADELPALAAWTFGPADAARVAAPALLICGAESRPWFRENVAILAEMLPDARTRNPARAGSPRAAHPPRGTRLHHRRVRQPPGCHRRLKTFRPPPLPRRYVCWPPRSRRGLALAISPRIGSQ